MRERENGKENGESKKKDLKRDLVKSEKRIPPSIQGDLLPYPRGNVLWEKIQRSRDDFSTHSETPDKSIRLRYSFIRFFLPRSAFALPFCICASCIIYRRFNFVYHSGNASNNHRTYNRVFLRKIAFAIDLLPRIFVSIPSNRIKKFSLFLSLSLYVCGYMHINVRVRTVAHRLSDSVASYFSIVFFYRSLRKCAKSRRLKSR